MAAFYLDVNRADEPALGDFRTAIDCAPARDNGID
jgi:hypothetical protein